VALRQQCGESEPREKVSRQADKVFGYDRRMHVVKFKKRWRLRQFRAPPRFEDHGIGLAAILP